MKNFLKVFWILFVSLLFTTSCGDFSFNLNVENPEHPSDEILAKTTPLFNNAETILNRWYLTVHGYVGPGMMLKTMADVATCSWGMFGVNNMSSEPRKAWNNNSNYPYSRATENYFDRLYKLLADANELIKFAEISSENEDADLVLLMGKVGQAFSVGYLSLVFDRVWISDENGMVGENPVDYKQGMTWALQKLDEAIELATTKQISVPETWLPGGGGSNERFVAFLNSMGARMMVGNLRNKAQKENIDWNRVLNYTNNGLATDFEIYMDDETWYDLLNTYMVYPGWARVDMRIVHMMDPNTPDYWTDDIEMLPESMSDDARLATDYQYLSNNNFRPTRGKYHFSSYRYSRLDYYISEWTTNLVEFSLSENDMYKAEALLNLEKVADAAAVVNAGTRTTRGKLPPVEVVADSVYKAIHYERMVEFAYTGIGIGFFEMRKEDLLQKGTLLHFPVPGAALEVIPEEYYTFGGTEGDAGEDYSVGGWR